MELETLAKIILLIAFGAVVLYFVGNISTDIGMLTEHSKEGACWFTNMLDNNLGFGKHFTPTSCQNPFLRNEPLEDAEEVANLIYLCWWMYGSGEWDMGSRTEEDENIIVSALKIFSRGAEIPLIDEELNFYFNCYAFQTKKDIKQEEVFAYMQNHRINGKKLSSPKSDESIWNIMQKNTKGDSVIFSKKVFGDSDQTLKEGEIYYILYGDYLNPSLKATPSFKDFILIYNEKFKY